MDLSMMADFVSPTIVIACLIVGWLIKNIIPQEQVNKFIPLIVAVLGIVLNVWSAEWVVTLPILLTGAISGLASTGLYEAFNNFLGDLLPSGKVEGDHVAE